MKTRTRVIAEVTEHGENGMYMRRAALFAWISGNRLAWIEPQYVDAWTSRPADHHFTGEPYKHEDGSLRIDTEKYSIRIVEPTADDRDAMRAMDVAIKVIRDKGITVEAEGDELMHRLDAQYEEFARR